MIFDDFNAEAVTALRAAGHLLNTQSALPLSLLEIARLRTSQMNGCSFCQGMHAAELKKQHEPETRIAAIERWRESDAFTPRERAALAWTESLTLIAETHAADTDLDAVSEFFQRKDLADLTMAVSIINAWNRMSVASRMEWKPKHRDGASGDGKTVDAVADDGGKVAED